MADKAIIRPAIEKGVPLRRAHTGMKRPRNTFYFPFDEMEHGDSFFCEATRPNHITNVFKDWRSRDPARQYLEIVCRSSEGGVRAWLVDRRLVDWSTIGGKRHKAERPTNGSSKASTNSVE